MNLSIIFYFSFVEAINNVGYVWFLDHFVNNEYGKWPLVVGSAEFIVDKFDPATLAGKKQCNAMKINISTIQVDLNLRAF